MRPGDSHIQTLQRYMNELGRSDTNTKVRNGLSFVLINAQPIRMKPVQTLLVPSTDRSVSQYSMIH